MPGVVFASVLPDLNASAGYWREALKVVLESMQRDTTQEEVCQKFGIASSMLHRWRKEFQAKATSVFNDKRDPKQKAHSQGYRAGGIV